MNTRTPRGLRHQSHRAPQTRGFARGSRPKQLPPRHARSRTLVRFRPRDSHAALLLTPSHLLVGGGVRKAGFIVLAGSGLGTGISFLATPFISRIFAPAVYGRFAFITGVVSAFVGVSTFRLEVQALRVRDDAEATAL